MALTYRADIDGLRAVAVLPVVAFHFGQPWAPGGFVGVDVFFVISGFLITSIIAGELREGRFSLANFYARRVRRIFPALFVVIAAVLAACTVIFLPTDLNNAAQSAAAAALFVSNLLFYAEAGYFDAAAYTKPLLHTWSLAIEEQFYIVVPLLLMFLARREARAGLWIALLTLLSLGLSIATTERFPTEAYYLLPWRAWELGVGALLALNMVPALGPRWLREGAGLLGILMILGAVVFLDHTVPFPGAAALLPVLGAALIIQAGQGGAETGVGRVLGAALPVAIGKISYSLYLWHWPLVVGYVYLTLDLPGPFHALLLFALSVILAWGSWRFVERPFRQAPLAEAAPRRRTLWAGALAILLVVGVSAVFVLGRGLPQRFPGDIVALTRFSHDEHPRTGECFRRKRREASWAEPCIFGDPSAEAPRIALWGDSHGPAWLSALEAAAEARGEALALYAHDGCPGFPDFQVTWIGESHDCLPYLERATTAILEDPDLELVIYVMRAQIYTQGWLDSGIIERDRRPLLIGPAGGPPLPPGEARSAFFFERFSQAIAALQAAGKQVAIVYPLPEAKERVPQALMRFLLRGGAAEDLILPRAEFDRRSAEIIAGFDELVAEHGVIAIRPDAELCDARGCQLTLEGVPLFRDGNHLSATAARRLVPLFDGALDLLGDGS